MLLKLLELETLLNSEHGAPPPQLLFHLLIWGVYHPKSFPCVTLDYGLKMYAYTKAVQKIGNLFYKSNIFIFNNRNC